MQKIGLKAVLKINQICKSFGGYKALNQVQFSIPEGKIFGLLGPNGAGKTSLIRLITQINQADSGEILFNDGPLNRSHNSKIGYLPEERGLYKDMEVGAHLIFLAQLKGLDAYTAKNQCMHWLDKFDIVAWKNKKIASLSKGMAQKIQFIAAVIHQPDLIILDEPFSGFDPINTELIKKEILALKDEKKTIIYSTHNMNSVDEICDHIALINQGEIILKGKLATLKQKFAKGLFEIVFIGNMISFTTALWTGFELIHSEEVEAQKFKVLIKAVDQANINTLLSLLLSSCKILSVNEKIPSIHEIFIQCIHDLTLKA